VLARRLGVVPPAGSPVGAPRQRRHRGDHQQADQRRQARI
jgi:hypothetical protein